MQHVLAAKQFTPELIEELLQKADKFRKQMQTNLGRSELAKLYPDKVVATIFYEPSTRTRLSHEAAASRLGAHIISTENASEFSSAIKGETIEDTIRTIQCYADVIVMRHKENGAAELASKVADVPIVNAGDGTGEHPTQGLLDVYTIWHEKGRLDNLKLVLGGDLAHGRTVRTLAQLMSLYEGNEITFVSTPELCIGEDIKSELRARNIKFTETDDIVQPMIEADVVYWTRLQKERLKDPSLASGYSINNTVTKMLPKDAVIMHPLPRVDEIAVEVDEDPRAAYFRQVENGLYVRMALFDYLFTEGSVK